MSNSRSNYDQIQFSRSEMRKKRMWVQSVGCYIITKTSRKVGAMQIGWKLRPRKYLDEIWIPFKTAWCISSCWGVSKIAAGDWVSVVRTKRSTISWPILLSISFCMVYPLWPMLERNHWPRARLVSLSFSKNWSSTIAFKFISHAGYLLGQLNSSRV